MGYFIKKGPRVTVRRPNAKPTEWFLSVMNFKSRAPIRYPSYRKLIERTPPIARSQNFMHVEKNEPVALATQDDDRVFPVPNALLVAGTLGSVGFLGSAIVFSPIVSFFGGLIGASLGIAAFSAITGHRVHSVVAAILGAILAPVLSATLMVVCMLIFRPDPGETPHGQTIDATTLWWLFYVFIVLPVSLIVGAIGGYRLNYRSANS